MPQIIIAQKADALTKINDPPRPLALPHLYHGRDPPPESKSRAPRSDARQDPHRGPSRVGQSSRAPIAQLSLSLVSSTAEPGSRACTVFRVSSCSCIFRFPSRAESSPPSAPARPVRCGCPLTHVVRHAAARALRCRAHALATRHETSLSTTTPHTRWFRTLSFSAALPQLSQTAHDPWCIEIIIRTAEARPATHVSSPLSHSNVCRTYPSMPRFSPAVCSGPPLPPCSWRNSRAAGG